MPQLWDICQGQLHIGSRTSQKREEKGERETTGSKVGGVELSEVPDTVHGATIGGCLTGLLTSGPVSPRYVSSPPFQSGNGDSVPLDV